MFLPSVKNQDVLYVWVDDDEHHLRSRTLAFEKEDIEDVSELPVLQLIDEQSKETNVLVKPVTMFNDPFALSKNRLIFCEMLNNSNNQAGKFTRL